MSSSPAPTCQTNGNGQLADLAMLIQYVEAIRAQLDRERRFLLAMVDERERLLGIEPRTAELRRQWHQTQ